jgi:hypothetical protein
MLSVRAARLNSKGLTCRVFFFDARLFSLWCSLPFPPSPAASEIPLWSFFPKAGASKSFYSSLESKKRAQKETPEPGSEARRYTLGLRICGGSGGNLPP